jgi:hypothetical protein
MAGSPLDEVVVSPSAVSLFYAMKQIFPSPFATLRLPLRLCVEKCVSREGAKEDAKKQRSKPD